MSFGYLPCTSERPKKKEKKVLEETKVEFDPEKTEKAMQLLEQVLIKPEAEGLERSGSKKGRLDQNKAKTIVRDRHLCTLGLTMRTLDRCGADADKAKFMIDQAKSELLVKLTKTRQPQSEIDKVLEAHAYLVKKYVTNKESKMAMTVDEVLKLKLHKIPKNSVSSDTSESEAAPKMSKVVEDVMALKQKSTASGKYNATIKPKNSSVSSEPDLDNPMTPTFQENPKGLRYSSSVKEMMKRRKADKKFNSGHETSGEHSTHPGEEDVFI